MNEKILAWLVAALDKATAASGAIIDFLAGEIPQFIREFILFNLVYNWMCVLVGVLIILASAYFMYRLHKALIPKDWDCAPWFMLYLVPCILALLGCMLISKHIYLALLILFAPRIFLLTEFLHYFGK